MFEYHGWLSTFESLKEKEIEKKLNELNGGYPVSARYVNGKLHVSFSGNPNRNLGQVEKIVAYLCSLGSNMSGCVYINDANSERYNKFDVIKIVGDVAIEIEDNNFTREETSRLFE